MPNTNTPPPPPSIMPRSIPTLLLALAVVALVAAVGWLAACDDSADAGVRRDQLGSDVRAGGHAEDLESHVRSRSGISNPRFNSSTVLLSPPSSGGSITLTAGGSVATVALVDGWATCIGSGASTPDVHLIGADLNSGAISISGEETIVCEASSTAEPKPATYDLWVGSVHD